MIIRRDICLGGLAHLPAGSEGHGLPLPELLGLLRAKGYAGVVSWGNWSEIRDAGLIPCGMGRVRLPADALPIARQHRDCGLDFTTLHVGTGFETDDEMARLAQAVVEAAALTGQRLHIETHRATMTQDIRRTLDLVARFPQLSLTLDFSHWYTGHEMTYDGEFAERLVWLDPLFRRVDSLQLRIGTSGAIQRPIDPTSIHYGDHLGALDRCLSVRSNSPDPPALLSVAPELLPAWLGDGEAARPIHYADEPEHSDRFAEALALSILAEDRHAKVSGLAQVDDNAWTGNVCSRKSRFNC
jgi:hypothetical protein